MQVNLDPWNEVHGLEENVYAWDSLDYWRILLDSAFEPVWFLGERIAFFSGLTDTLVVPGLPPPSMYTATKLRGRDRTVARLGVLGGFFLLFDEDYADWCAAMLHPIVEFVSTRLLPFVIDCHVLL